MATLHVVAGSHTEGQLCVGCACVCLRFPHTPAALLNAPFHQKDRADGPELLLPLPLLPLFTEVCVEISPPLLHRFYAHSPPTHAQMQTTLPASNLMPPSFKDITLCLCSGLSHVSWLFFFFCNLQPCLLFNCQVTRDGYQDIIPC